MQSVSIISNLTSPRVKAVPNCIFCGFNNSGKMVSDRGDSLRAGPRSGSTIIQHNIKSLFHLETSALTLFFSLLYPLYMCGLIIFRYSFIPFNLIACKQKLFTVNQCHVTMITPIMFWIPITVC